MNNNIYLRHGRRFEMPYVDLEQFQQLFFAAEPEVCDSKRFQVGGSAQKSRGTRLGCSWRSAESTRSREVMRRYGREIQKILQWQLLES